MNLFYFGAATVSICSYWEFRCDNGYQCVDNYYRCDGRRQCYDGSDEWNCGMYTSVMLYGAFVRYNRFFTSHEEVITRELCVKER